MYKSLVQFAGVVVLAAMLSGCGLIDYFYLPPPEDTAQELFEAGNDAMREKNYVSAAGYFTKIRDNFPFSPYAVEAELSLGDCYYLNEDWGDAAEAYKEFESMHPGHEAIPYVLYHIAMANVNGYPSIDRPTTPIEEAYFYFQRLAESYPGTEYASASKEKMQLCRKIMAEHELYYGDFYHRMGKYGSALIRYQYILDNFPDVPEIHEHARVKASDTFVKERSTRSEEVRESREGSWKDYFNWL